MLKPSVILIVSIICRDLTIRLNWASAHRIRRGRARAVARGVKMGRPAKLTPYQQREAYTAPAWRSKPGRPACRPRVGPARPIVRLVPRLHQEHCLGRLRVSLLGVAAGSAVGRRGVAPAVSEHHR